MKNVRVSVAVDSAMHRIRIKPLLPADKEAQSNQREEAWKVVIVNRAGENRWDLSIGMVV
jgi:hypothetical protein